jgi:hypothetical protein
MTGTFLPAFLQIPDSDQATLENHIELVILDLQNIDEPMSDCLKV